MPLLILGLILFVCLVLVHEWGHYYASRRSGVVVEEFGIGFPPKLWGKKLKSKMLLSINALPLGGFVRLKGEHDSDTAPGSYGAASLGNKVKIMTAGVVMNLLVAIALFTIIALVGMPKLVENQFSVQSNAKVTQSKILAAYVEPGSPAEKAGLASRDQITAVGVDVDHLKPIENINTFPATTKSFAGKQVIVQTRRGSDVKNLSVQLRTTEEVEKTKNSSDPKGYLGVVPTEYLLQRYTWSAPIVAVGTAGQFTWLTLQGIGSAIGNIFSGHAKDAANQVSGPVGIFVILKDGSLLGYQFILMIVAVISLTLAIMNILPIPALDGGRLFVTLLYRAIKKPLTRQTEERIHGIGFAALMGLFVLITIVDVRRFF